MQSLHKCPLFGLAAVSLSLPRVPEPTTPFDCSSHWGAVRTKDGEICITCLSPQILNGLKKRIHYYSSLDLILQERPKFLQNWGGMCKVRFMCAKASGIGICFQVAALITCHLGSVSQATAAFYYIQVRTKLLPDSVYHKERKSERTLPLMHVKEQ